MILLQVRWIGRKLCAYFGRMFIFSGNLSSRRAVVGSLTHNNKKQSICPDTSQSVNHRAVVKESGVHEHDTVLSFLLCGLGKRTATLADILRLHVSNLSRTINPHSFFRHCFQSETINTAVSTKEKF